MTVVAWIQGSMRGDVAHPLFHDIATLSMGCGDVMVRYFLKDA